MSKRPKGQPARWYETETGRWDSAVEAALASGDERRRNLAWVIIGQTGGLRGCQSQFAERIGKTQGQVSSWLRGVQGITDDAIEALVEGTGLYRLDFIRPDHPLAIRHGNGPAWEPGDPEWLKWWTVWSQLDPEHHPPIRDLIRDYPHFFPKECDQF